MPLAHMQAAGHRPIGIVGGGTAMVGDPSGQTELRASRGRDGGLTLPARGLTRAFGGGGY
jgi:tyrosyl-tRNA synthetase